MSEYRDEAGEYSGELFDGVPNGQGIKFYSPTIYFEGNWENGAKSGIGFYNYEGIQFCFSFKQGKIDKIYYEREDGAYLEMITVMQFDSTICTEFNGKNFTEKIKQSDEDPESAILSGIFDNLSHFILGEGSKRTERYEGSYVNMKYEGFGRLFNGNDLVYEGEFSRGLKSGKGKEFNLGRLVYEGEFQENFYHGAGIMHTESFTIKGEFRYNEPYGKMVTKTGGFLYEGDLKHYLPHGQGKLESSEYSYTGEFKYGFPDKFGKQELKPELIMKIKQTKNQSHMQLNSLDFGFLHELSDEMYEKKGDLHEMTFIGIFKKNNLLDGKIIIRLAKDIVCTLHKHRNGFIGFSFIDNKGVITMKKRNNTHTFTFY